YAGFQVINGNLTVGTMVAFVGYMERVYSPLRRLINASTLLTQSIASIDRVFELMNEKYDIEDKKDAVKLGRLAGNILFEKIGFQYNDDEQQWLKDVNLVVKKSETIASVGMTGRGKSTIISLTPHFYDVTEGSIKVEGIDVRD